MMQHPYLTQGSTALMRGQLNTQEIQNLRCKLRLRLLRMHYESRVGHIGGNLSALDLLISLYHLVLQDGDLFVLSKGHAAGALYVALGRLES